MGHRLAVKSSASRAIVSWVVVASLGFWIPHTRRSSRIFSTASNVRSPLCLKFLYYVTIHTQTQS